jgi:TPR repeat protein
MRELGWRYAKGIGVAQDRDASLRWYKSAAGKGDVESKFRLGVLVGDKNLIHEAAEGGFPEALCALGSTETDKQKALELFRRAAQAGYINAWTRLGVATSDMSLLEKAAAAGDGEALFRLGESAAQRGKKREAYRYFERAAESGYAPSMVRLGDANFNGEGTSRNEIDALKWYRQAAMAGDEGGWAALKRLKKTL